MARDPPDKSKKKTMKTKTKTTEESDSEASAVEAYIARIALEQKEKRKAKKPSKKVETSSDDSDSSEPSVTPPKKLKGTAHQSAKKQAVSSPESDDSDAETDTKHKGKGKNKEVKKSGSKKTSKQVTKVPESEAETEPEEPVKKKKTSSKKTSSKKSAKVETTDDSDEEVAVTPPKKTKTKQIKPAPKKEDSSSESERESKAVKKAQRELEEVKQQLEEIRKAADREKLVATGQQEMSKVAGQIPKKDADSQPPIPPAEPQTPKPSSGKGKGKETATKAPWAGAAQQNAQNVTAANDQRLEIHDPPTVIHGVDVTKLHMDPSVVQSSAMKNSGHLLLNFKGPKSGTPVVTAYVAAQAAAQKRFPKKHQEADRLSATMNDMFYWYKNEGIEMRCVRCHCEDIHGCVGVPCPACREVSAVCYFKYCPPDDDNCYKKFSYKGTCHHVHDETLQALAAALKLKLPKLEGEHTAVNPKVGVYKEVIIAWKNYHKWHLPRDYYEGMKMHPNHQPTEVPPLGCLKKKKEVAAPSVFADANASMHDASKKNTKADKGYVGSKPAWAAATIDTQKWKRIWEEKNGKKVREQANLAKVQQDTAGAAAKQAGTGKEKFGNAASLARVRDLVDEVVQELSPGYTNATEWKFEDPEGYQKARAAYWKEWEQGMRDAAVGLKQDMKVENGTSDNEAEKKKDAPKGEEKKDTPEEEEKKDTPEEEDPKQKTEKPVRTESTFKQTAEPDVLGGRPKVIKKTRTWYTDGVAGSEEDLSIHSDSTMA
ncbi:hypothetical protein LTR56_001761 [Elasticomyces elasticus]|nr:hypothetical protein LTR56_001761 [Elasticomyces elasticus]KAK3668888.1 hypothetical protein LTR22_000368 [Elasticomyces elasticus]KAK4925004.1 hypothetical protein LTR49_008010 [Elasticomyces elasticus]KAK5763261.1 hypothetical protein LTS12_006645 [Elasticomyces elasticus]